MARPLKEIDADLVEKLASVGCTVEEVALVCDCSRDTLERRFAANIAKGRAEGRTSLRKLQWDSARSGNVTMQIFLGKVVLGQREDAAEIEALRVKVEELTLRLVG